jgi:nucleotide-binding universal stress UspA family protein
MSRSAAIRHILLAYDASEEADAAFEYARTVAKHFDAALVVLSVVTHPAFADNVELTASLEEGRKKAEQALRRLRHVTKGEGFSVNFLIKVGRPPEQILAHAESIGADLIVMGHRHRSLMERAFAQSTAIKVMEYANCPTLIVR